MKFVFINTIAMVMSATATSAIELVDDPIERQIMAVEIASIAGDFPHWCEGSAYNEAAGQKILARAISSLGAAKVHNLASAFHEQLQSEVVENTTLFCAEARELAANPENKIPLRFK